MHPLVDRVKHILYDIALLGRSYYRCDKEWMQDHSDSSHGHLIDPIRRSYLHDRFNAGT